MKARQQRMLFIGAVAVGLVIAAAFAYRAFDSNMLYYYEPTRVLAGEAPVERTFRLGGLVVEDSVRRAPGSLTVTFEVTDLRNTIPVEYTGVLPDLFAEGQGVVTHGRLQPDGQFVADRVLAKHDENYMAPEVAESLNQSEQGYAGPGK